MVEYPDQAELSAWSKLPGLIVGIAEMWARDLLGQRRTAKCESCREAFINAGIPKATTVLTHADGVR